MQFLRAGFCTSEKNVSASALSNSNAAPTHSQDTTLGVTQRPPCCRAALAAQVVTSEPNTGLRDFVLTFTSCLNVPELQQLQSLSKQLSSAAGSGIGPYPGVTADCSIHLLS